MTTKKSWKWVITFNVKPYSTTKIRSANGYIFERPKRYVWPLRFNSREDATNYLTLIAPRLFANSRFPDGRRIVSSSIERFRA